MSFYSKSAQSIWQKICHLLSNGFDKVAAQELQIANTMSNKLSGIGYRLIRLVFFVVKLALIVCLFWIGLWLFLMMMIWLVFKFITFNKPKPYPSMDDVSHNNTSKRSNTYDNNGNLLD